MYHVLGLICQYFGQKPLIWHSSWTLRFPVCVSQTGSDFCSMTACYKGRFTTKNTLISVNQIRQLNIDHSNECVLHFGFGTMNLLEVFRQNTRLPVDWIREHRQTLDSCWGGLSQFSCQPFCSLKREWTEKSVVQRDLLRLSWVPELGMSLLVTESIKVPDSTSPQI